MIKRLTLSFLVLALTADLRAEPINTGTILSSALNFSCIKFQVIGVCLWLVCTPFGCEIETSAKYGHYNPDLVVSAHNGIANNPWTEMKALLAGIQTTGAGAVLSAMGGQLPNLLGGGTTTECGIAGRPAREHPAHKNLIFKDSDAIGHPAAGFFLCPSASTPFQPYLVSALDALSWRWAIPEFIYPQSLIPGLREIGDWPLNTWGAVYPRGGFVTQAEDPKAAAVVAQRAGDVVTRTGQPHVYIALESDKRKEKKKYMVWYPPSLKEGDAKTGTWQMLTPKRAGSCEVFGSNDLMSFSGWAGSKVAADGNYAFTLWRPYKCCKVKGSFIGSIDIMSYPSDSSTTPTPTRTQ